MHLSDYALHVYVCIGPHCIIAKHFENNMESCIFMVNTLSVVLANIVMQQNGRIPLSSLMN